MCRDGKKKKVIQIMCLSNSSFQDPFFRPCGTSVHWLRHALLAHRSPKRAAITMYERIDSLFSNDTLHRSWITTTLHNHVPSLGNRISIECITLAIMNLQLRRLTVRGLQLLVRPSVKHQRINHRVTLCILRWNVNSWLVHVFSDGCLYQRRMQ